MQLTRVVDKSSTILSLFPPGEMLGKLTEGVLVAVHKSFQGEHKMNEITQQEIRRRSAICMDWAKTFRGDLKWGIQRVVDTLPDALNSELSGKKYVPSNRQCWITADGA